MMPPGPESRQRYVVSRLTSVSVFTESRFGFPVVSRLGTESRFGAAAESRFGAESAGVRCSVMAVGGRGDVVESAAGDRSRLMVKRDALESAERGSRCNL